MSNLAPAQRHQVTQQALAKLHPQAANAGMVQKMTSWAWDNHPWSLGAFTFLMPSQQRSLYADVVAPEGRIYFAGSLQTFSSLALPQFNPLSRTACQNVSLYKADAKTI